MTYQELLAVANKLLKRKARLEDIIFDIDMSLERVDDQLTAIETTQGRLGVVTCK